MTKKENAPQEARHSVDWSFVWAGIRGVLIGVAAGKLLGIITKLLWGF